MKVEKSLQKTLLQVKDWAHRSRHCIHFLSQTYFLAITLPFSPKEIQMDLKVLGSFSLSK